MMAIKNVFANLPAVERGERFEAWLTCKNVIIERIVSSDQPEPATYDQAQDEWVLLLQGRARLEVEGRELTLEPGDTLFIPAHARHRLLETSTETQCLWLAVHIH